MDRQHEGDAAPGGADRNRSLERGIDILRAFRAGAGLLGNGELAERTGLSRSTVSRLSQTLVACGFLEHDRQARAYRLAPAVLSLGHAMRSGSPALLVGAPIMRAVAEANKVNVGMAAPDRDEMVYLESIRYNRRAALRSVVSGQRVPMELTSLGRAYLAVAPEAERQALLALFEQRRGAQWAGMAEEIRAAAESVARRGYCAAAWQPEVVAIATPLRAGSSPLVLNLSVSTTEPLARVARELGPRLLEMAQRIEKALMARTEG